MHRLLICLMAVLLVGGCGDVAPQVRPPEVPSAQPSASVAASSSAASASGGWEVTVYYTAVEAYHHGPKLRVRGCPKLDCEHGRADLGSYPKDFVQAVKDEGTGRTSAGEYLNWSYDTGYWLDTATRDSYGHPLRPFVSAAADPGVLARGTRFTIADCGTRDDGSAPSETVCAALREAKWLVTDEFTPGLGGSRHIDAYIGLETGPGFTDSEWYITLTGATLQRS